jgi:hypothetical protein
MKKVVSERSLCFTHGIGAAKAKKKIRILLTFLLMIALSTGNNQATKKIFVVNLMDQG